MSKNDAVEARKLTKRYGDLVALGPLDLKISKGQRVSLIGANGSGKTTFLRAASGLLEVSDGDVLIQGEKAGSLEARAEVSFIPDDPVLYDDLSVREHLEYLGPLYGSEDWPEKSRQLLDKLGIAHRSEDVPTGFSRGLRQKTSLAIGFLRPFSVLMVDEPFVGLVEPGRQALLSLLDEVSESGATVVVASHQLDLIDRADRVIALQEGQITYDGSPGKVDLVKLVGG
jgi:ABC-type multidrug transport system ATPase subunit